MTTKSPAAYRLLTLFLVCAGAQTGCKGSDEPSDDGITTGTAGTAGANTGGAQSTAAGGAAAGNTSSSVGGSGSGNELRTGQFLLVSVFRSSSTSAGVMARFYTTPPSGCPAAQIMGDCKLTPPCSLASTATAVSAGTLTVTAPATTPPINVAMTPNADNSYDGPALSSPLTGLESVHLAASGGTVPAFSADVSVALALLVDSPTPDASGVIAASATSDLTIHFTRGTNAAVLYLETLTGSNTDGLLTCESALGASSLTIPAAALAASSGRSISLWTFTRQVLTVGDFAVTVGALMDAYTTDKLHNVTITLQ